MNKNRQKSSGKPKTYENCLILEMKLHTLITLITARNTPGNTNTRGTVGGGKIKKIKNEKKAVPRRKIFKKP